MQQQSGAIFYALSQPDDTAGADFDPSITHFVQRIQALLVGAGGDDVAVKFRRGIKVVVVVIEARFGQALRLTVGQGAERHTGLQPQRLHPFHHLLQVRHIAVIGVFPRRAHAEAGGAGVFRLAR